MKTMKKVLAVLMCLSCAVLFVLFFQKAFVVESPFTDPVYVRPLSSIFGYVWKNPVMEKAELLLSGAPWMVLMGIIPMSLLIIWVVLLILPICCSERSLRPESVIHLHWLS